MTERKKSERKSPAKKKPADPAPIATSAKKKPADPPLGLAVASASVPAVPLRFQATPRLTVDWITELGVGRSGP